MQTTGGTALSAREEATTTEPESATSADADVSPPAVLSRAGRRRLILLVGTAAVLVWLLDRVTKAIAVAELADRPPVELLGGLLKLNLVYNKGAAFGVAAGYTLVLSLLALGVVVFVVVLARKIASLPWAVAFGLLLGGASGNLTDRMLRPPGPLRGYVVDFIELPRWPVFNIADTAVCCAAVLIVLLSLTGRHLDGTRDGRPASQPAADEPAPEK